MARERLPLNTYRIPPFRAIPASVCDGCGKFGCGLHAAGSIEKPGVECECGGRQRHHNLWRFAWCPACGGQGAKCEACRWKGMVATPRE